MKEKMIIIKKEIVLFFVILISISIIYAENLNITGSQVKFNDKVSVAWNDKVDHPKTIGDLNTFIIKSGGSLSVSYKGDSRTYSELQDSKRNEFIFDKSGNLKEAYFTPSKTGRYKLGNKEFEVPAGADVVFKDGVATIAVNSEMKIDRPGTISGMDSSDDITLAYVSDKGFILDNGNKFKGTLKYKDGFFFDSDATLGKLNVKNPNKVPTYIFYDGNPNSVKGAYISIDQTNGKMTLGCNVNIRGPVVQFEDGNAFGVRIEKGDYFAMQALGNEKGSYISIQNREKNNPPQIPYVKTLNQFVMEEDGGSFYFNTNDQKLHFVNRGDAIDGLKAPDKSTTTPLEIHSYKNINGNEEDISKYKNVLGIANDNYFGYGPDPRFMKTHTTEFYKSKLAPGLYTGFSNSLAYNYDITLRGLRKFTGINIIDRVGVTNDPKNVKMLMDIFASLPAGNFQQWGISRFELVNTGGWSGLADSEDNTFYINVDNGGFTPGVIRHELTHLHDFSYRFGNGAFTREWQSIGGDKGPHTYDYGYEDMEDTSTFGEFAYRTDPWKQWLSPDYKYNAKFKGKLALFTKYNFISREEASRILSVAGLSSDVSDATLNKYISDARDAYRRLG